jgi:hypothetical protein
LFIKIWLIERFDMPDALGNVGFQTPAEPMLYSYIVNAVVLGFIFMVPSVIKGVAVERQTGIKVDMKC